MECIKLGAWNYRARIVVYREMPRPVLLTVTQLGQDPVRWKQVCHQELFVKSYHYPTGKGWVAGGDG